MVDQSVLDIGSDRKFCPESLTESIFFWEKMKKGKIVWFTVILGLLLICMADSVWGKRAFAIRMRGKNQSGGISRYSRKNHQMTHMSDNVSGGMVRNPPVPDVPPARSVGSSGPIGPPPAYPGLGNQKVPAGGAPPAYSKIGPPSYAEAMGYSSYGHHYGSAGSPGRHYDYNTNNNNNNNLPSIYSQHNVAGYGSNYGYHRGSNPFNMGSIVAGASLYHLGHSYGHSGYEHHHHHHHGYNHDYPHRHHEHHDEEDQPTGSTLTPETENSHIQVNADFDFGPSPAPAPQPARKIAIAPTPEPAKKIGVEPNMLSSLNGSTT